MKKCPQCSRVYADQSFDYCLDDGSWLIDEGRASDDTAIIPTDVTSDDQPTRKLEQFETKSVPQPGEKPSRPASLPIRSLYVAALGVALLGTSILGLYWFSGSRSVASINSIAVMPFVNESGNAENEYLSDGMTEMLISDLSQLPNLSVKARSSVFRYKGKDPSPATVAKELSVQAILLGRIVQRGETLTLSLELVDPNTENVIWSANYDRKQADLVLLQREIAHDVANNLRTKLTGADRQKLAKNSTHNGEAFQLYLKGRYYWYRFPSKDFEKSRDYFQRAVDIDPNNALAQSGLAAYYGFGAASGFLPPNDDNWSRSRTAANAALALDESLPDAHNALAGVKQFNNDRAGAESEIKRAIELDLNYAEGHNHYSHFLLEDGRIDAAISEITKALELESLSVPFNRFLGTLHYLNRRYQPAIDQYRKTLDIDPNDSYTHELLGDAYEQNGMQKDAISEWSRALVLSGNNDAASTLERTFAGSNFNAAVRSLWQTKLEQFNERAGRNEYVPGMNFVLAYTRLENKEKALTWLTKAAAERNGLFSITQHDPIYDGLRDDPRFGAILREIASGS